MAPDDWLLVLDLLDQGVVVCDGDLVAIRAANREARQMFAALGGDDDDREVIPAAVRAAIGTSVGDDRFARAVEITARDGHRYFARARRIPDPPGGVLLLVAEARVRRDQ